MTFAVSLGMSYHLWLVPQAAATTPWAKTIVALARRYGTSPFVPHVTLLGDLPGSEAQIQERAERLAADLHPFQVRFGAVDFTERYFQCLFLRVVPTLPLRDAHAEARTLFLGGRHAPYQPHLSLLYGRFSITVKQRIVAALPHELWRPFRVQTLEVIRADSHDPKDWHSLKRLRVGGEEHGENETVSKEGSASRGVGLSQRGFCSA